MKNNIQENSFSSVLLFFVNKFYLWILTVCLVLWKCQYQFSEGNISEDQQCNFKIFQEADSLLLILFTLGLIDWLFGFYSISTLVGYLMPNIFYTNNQFNFKQFSLAWVRSLIVKNISISSYSV